MHALVIENCCLLVHETFVNVLMENICILVLKFCQFNIFDYQQENNTFFFVQTSKSNSVCLMKQIKFFRRPLLHDTWRIYHFRVKNCFRSWLFLLRTLWPWGLAIEFSGIINTVLGFPHSSVGKESACNAGELGLIPGSGRSPAEGNGHLLQYSCLENSTDRGAWHATVRRVARVQHDLVTKPPSQPYNLQAHTAFS